jgi:transposase-like protein
LIASRSRPNFTWLSRSALSAEWFHDEAAAYAKLESILWPHGPVCPRCGGLDRITKVKGGRMGLWRCGPCKRQFRVTVGTVSSPPMCR